MNSITKKFKSIIYNPNSHTIYYITMNNLNLYPTVLCGQVLKSLIRMKINQ